jgi:hypothetical protein
VVREQRLAGPEDVERMPKKRKIDEVDYDAVERSIFPCLTRGFDNGSSGMGTASELKNYLILLSSASLRSFLSPAASQFIAASSGYVLTETTMREILLGTYFYYGTCSE